MLLWTGIGLYETHDKVVGKQIADHGQTVERVRKRQQHILVNSKTTCVDDFGKKAKDTRRIE